MRRTRFPTPETFEWLVPYLFAAVRVGCGFAILVATRRVSPLGAANVTVPAPSFFQRPRPRDWTVERHCIGERRRVDGAGGSLKVSVRAASSTTLPVVCKAPAPLVTLPLPKLAELEMLDSPPLIVVPPLQQFAAPVTGLNCVPRPL